jgi:hypothetical protein
MLRVIPAATLAASSEALTRAADAVLAANRAAHGPDRNRRVRELRASGEQVIASMRALLALRFDVTVDVVEDEEAIEEQVAAGEEAQRAFLATIRGGIAAMTAPDLQLFEQQLARTAPDLSRTYKKLLPAALKRARDMLAIASFLGGEDDHLRMGYDFVPMPLAPGAARGPSVPLDDLLA